MQSFGRALSGTALHGVGCAAQQRTSRTLLSNGLVELYQLALGYPTGPALKNVQLLGLLEWQDPSKRHIPFANHASRIARDDEDRLEFGLLHSAAVQPSFAKERKAKHSHFSKRSAFPQ